MSDLTRVAGGWIDDLWSRGMQAADRYLDFELSKYDLELARRAAENERVAAGYYDAVYAPASTSEATGIDTNTLLLIGGGVLLAVLLLRR